MFANAQTPPPVLVSEPTSTRAIALESLTFMPEPFALVSSYSWSPDSRTRIMLFALNLSLQPGEDLSSVSADAEDSAHRNYNFQVEYVGPVSEQPWLSAVVIRFSDDLGDAGDVLVRISHKGVHSNRVRVAIGHRGGGPADDPGSGPTPAPPYFISGQVMYGGTGLSGVAVKLSGPQTETVITDANGVYQFTVLSAGSAYTVSASKPYYDFNPTSQTFGIPGNNQTNINITATRQAFAISGHVLDETRQGVDGVQLAITNEAGTTLGTSLTVNGGNYSFTNLPAGFAYTVTPVSNSIFTFIPQGPTLLTGNLTWDFRGFRRLYAISGRITDGASGLEGVTVTMSRPIHQTATTDSNGNYTFVDLDAGRNYTITPSKTQYVFTPSNLVLNNLSRDRSVDFNGLFRYFIRGRVLDNAPNGVAGVTITMAGSQSGTTVTAFDGTYSFAVAPLGSYAVTASIEQDWYSFTPSNQSLNSVSSDQTANFTATRAPFPNPSYVLEFDGTPKSVDYGFYWDPDFELGHFFWEFWAMPGRNAGATYLLSDGYGGAHALLFGFANFNTSEPGRYQFFGDIFNGITHQNYFTSDQGPAPDEWGHFAVGWDGQNIITYLDGVPVGKTVFTGPRWTPGPFGGGSGLLIGGSDHNNLDGRIAQVRGYEGSNPREDPTGMDKTQVESSFTPQTVFGLEGNLLSYYFRPATRVADLSTGYNGSHAGVLRGNLNGMLSPCVGCPLPKFVIDPTAPNFAIGAAPAPVAVDNPLSPGGARIFDSFSRANSTYMFNGNGGLGATESGTAGSKSWQTSQGISALKPFGILNGRAVMLANATHLTWIPTGSSSGNLDVRVDRRPGVAGSGLDTGLSFRVLDAQNFFFAYSSAGNDAPALRRLTVGYYLGGQRVDLATGLNMPSGWTTLRVVTKSSGQLFVYADATQVYTITNNNTLVNATGAGLYNNSSGLGLVNRWDNFTVFDAL